MTAADAFMGIFGFKRVEGGMKTDRELLELAAMAAGIQIIWKRGVSYKSHNGVRQSEWMPLSDEGEAFRLAMNLGFTVEPGKCWHSPYGPAFGEDVLDGVMTATRRAIVRAAAAIGEQMT